MASDFKALGNCSCSAEAKYSKNSTKSHVLKDDSFNFKQTICLRVNQSGNVKIYTKFTPVNKPSEAPTNDQPKTDVKPVVISKRPMSSSPAKRMNETCDFNPTKIIKMEKTAEEGNRPPISSIPLEQRSRLNPIVALHRFGEVGSSPLNIKHVGSSRIKIKKHPDFISKYMNWVDNDDNNTPWPASKTASPCLSLADMCDVKDLLQVCKDNISDEDLIVVDKLQKRLKTVGIDSIFEYETIYKEYVEKIRRKVLIFPDQLHMHLLEWFFEVKHCLEMKVIFNRKRQNLEKLLKSSATLSNKPKKWSTDEVSDDDSEYSIKANTKSIKNKINVLIERVRVLNEMEISVDDMDDKSPFIEVAKTEKKILKLWEYLCKLTGHSTNTLRFVDEPFVFEGTQYPELNKAIEHLVEKLKPNVPSYRKIWKIVWDSQGTNLLKYERISWEEVNRLALKILDMVINELRKRQNSDLSETLDYYIDYRPESSQNEDPADSDEKLRKVLVESNKLGRKKLCKIKYHFVQKQAIKDQIKARRRFLKWSNMWF